MRWGCFGDAYATPLRLFNIFFCVEAFSACLDENKSINNVAKHINAISTVDVYLLTHAFHARFPLSDGSRLSSEGTSPVPSHLSSASCKYNLGVIPVVC